MLDLATHGQKDQDKPIDHQDGPKHGQVEDLAPRAAEGNNNGTSSGVPELEFRKTAHEGLELVGLLGGKTAAAASFFHVFGGLETGVELGRDEGEKEVQKVDAKGVGDCAREQKVRGVDGIAVGAKDECIPMYQP